MRKSRLIIILLILTIVAGCTIPFTEDPPEQQLFETVPMSSPSHSEATDINDELHTFIGENNAAIKSLINYGSVLNGLPQYNERDYSSIFEYINETASQLAPTPFDTLDIDSAAAGLKEMLEQEFDINVNCVFHVESVDSMLLAVLLYNLNGNVDNSDSLSVASTMNYSIEPVEQVYNIDVQIAFPTVLETIESVCRDDFLLYMDIRFMYAYMLTLYNSEGEMAETPGNQDPLPEQWVFPLASHTRLTNTWLADRSNGIRKHTGTDLLADEGTEIYSCNEAIVLGVGYQDGTGYYVWTRDNYGYEFIYMHMMEMTNGLQVGDIVAAGDFIGKVGNTGNSATNHLHISVITPNNDYLNPFAELESALQRKNNPGASPVSDESTAWKP